MAIVPSIPLAPVRRLPRGAAIALVVVAIVAAVAAALRFVPAPWPATRIVNTIVITRSPATVFDYVTTPANWPRWHPSSIAVRGATDHPLEIGEEVTEDFVVAGRRGTAVWVVRDRDYPRRWTIAARVGENESAGTVTYTLTADPNGTRFERVLTYRFDTLGGALLDRLVVRERVAAESSEAVTRLQRAIESQPGS